MSARSGLDLAGPRLEQAFLERCQTPFLSIHLDAVRSNIDWMIQRMGGDPDRWRPHLKTAKLRSVYRELVAAGVRSFKCATTREAACMLDLLDELGVVGGDLLLAYPLVGPALARLGTLAAEHPATSVAVLTEGPEDVKAVPPGLGVWIDLDCGMHRTGVPLTDRARIAAVARAAGARLRGVHAYEGHVCAGSFEERCAQAEPIYRAVVDSMHALREDTGATIAEVVTSGTPSCLPALAFEGWHGLVAAGTRHRVSPGTVVLHDVRTMLVCDELALAPAAIVHAHVVSCPSEDIRTCNTGSKVIATDAGDPCAVVIGRPELVALTPSEEHLPLRVASGWLEDAPRRGDALALVPTHVCPTVNLAERVVVVEEGVVQGIEAVEARGHEL